MSNQCSPNANDWLINYHKTPQSSFGNSSDDNYTKFPKAVYRWIDPQGQKRQKELYEMHEGAKFMEANILQIKTFKTICNGAGWHGQQRFTYFSNLLGGEMADYWDSLMTDGDDIYDPANQDDDDDFDTAIRALFVKITGETMPGNVQHQRIMETKYVDTKVDNQWVKPSLYWRRKSSMWKSAAFYGRVGPDIQDASILEAEYYGLPSSARDWLEDEATGDGVDIFDAENDGAEMYTPSKMFDTLDKWHKKLSGSGTNNRHNNIYTEEEGRDKYGDRNNNANSEEENESDEDAARHNCTEEGGEQNNSTKEEDSDYSNAEGMENDYSNEEEESEEEEEESKEEEEESEDGAGADDKNYPRRKRARHDADTKGPAQYYGSYHQQVSYQQQPTHCQQRSSYQSYPQQKQGSYHQQRSYYQHPYQQQGSYYQQPYPQQVSYHQQPYTQQASSTASNDLSTSGTITKTVVWNSHTQQWE